MVDNEVKEILEKAAKRTLAPKVIILKETPLNSLMVDATTYALIVAVIGTGWFLGSTAMEWAGFIILGISAIAVATGKEDRKMTIKEAREYLDKLEKKD